MVAQAKKNNVSRHEFGNAGGVKLGRVVEIKANGLVMVDFPDNLNGPLSARFTRSVLLEDLQAALEKEQDVLLLFENNNYHKPIIIDVLYSFVDDIEENVEMQMDVPEDVVIDGKHITFDAKDQITMRCGKSSITLTKAGKVLIRGAYILNRSSGVNKIKGGSVQIN
jgi:hypothetical protein